MRALVPPRNNRPKEIVDDLSSTVIYKSFLLLQIPWKPKHARHATTLVGKEWGDLGLLNQEELKKTQSTVATNYLF